MDAGNRGAEALERGRTTGGRLSHGGRLAVAGLLLLALAACPSRSSTPASPGARDAGLATAATAAAPQPPAPPPPAPPPSAAPASQDATSCLGFHGVSAAGLAREDDVCERACNGGDMASCERLASNLENGLGRPRSAQRAAQLYRRACVSGQAARACRDLGLLLDGGSQIPRDHPAALAVWHEGCVQGDQPSCDYARKAQDH